MEFLVPLLKVVHLVVSVVLILIILVQPSKSGDIGSMFGGGTSESVFGSVGAVPFLVKLTRLFAFVFVVTSLSLGYFSVKSIKSSVVEDSAIEVPAEQPNAGEQTELPQGSPDTQRIPDSATNNPGVNEDTQQ